MIAITGYGARSDLEASRQAGFDEPLLKPVEFKRLLELLGGTRLREQAM